MLNPNHKNLSCEFAEQIVSYLYGENGGAEKQKFEKHLKNCEPCAEEFAAFSEMRFAFAELKDEFSLMKTPKIEIPYENSREIIEVSSVKTSWLDGVRAIFGNVSAWQMAAGFAVLTILAVFSIFLLRNDNRELAAENNKNTPKPTAKKTESNRVVKTEKSPEEVVVKDEKITEKQTDVATTTIDEPKEKSVVKVSERPQPQPKNNTVNKQTTPKNNNLKNNNRNDLPRLNNTDEIEDDSLRLADIFEEIDSTED